MRADARHNRLRILEAAAETLAAAGDTSLKSIARRAGVGQGTIYRHFPSREALVLEVYWEEVEELAAAVPALLGALNPPLALRTWLKRLLDVGACTPEFACAMSTAGDVLTEECGQAYQPLLDALSALVAANEAAGAIVPGTTAEDVLLLLGPLWRVGADDEEYARSERLLDVLLRGLCPSDGTRGALPGQ
ncbi:TetR/AcrR family transcriptional regulator [Streptomyces sp. NRRL B-24085]|uniref:TetR/AcrR family transcriptional regulator n=1 Tax=Streptomyces sp. NRRL B-24085 TaxID=1709476 RepID=UPI0006B2F43F|nr:TetR/AcrR family transcriptional regulator [Streptomyces sp. NRRL B-24085]